MFREFFPKRSKTLIEHFREDGGYPSLDPPSVRIEEGEAEETVTIVNPNTNGVVYYTIDGSDPREEWSGQPRGIIYRDSLSVGREILLSARVYDDGEWSALECSKNGLRKKNR
jgi:hypothetical protein